MLKMIIDAAPTISGMFECGLEVGRFVTNQHVRVLTQENGHWELEIARNMIAELTAALVTLEQVPEIHIVSIFSGVL